MIKNSFWKNFKLKTERNYNPEKDEKNIMNLVRPLSLKNIKNLRYGKLQIFIDDIISNKKVNNLLFSTNAKKELQFFYRQQNAVLKNMNFIKSYNQNKNKKDEGISEVAEIFLKKKNDLLLKNIKNDIEEFKINKDIEVKKYMKKYWKFNKKIENVYETSTKLFFKPVNDVRYSSYKRSLKSYFEKCKSDPNINLPDVSLDINNAFSRLYHNMIKIRSINKKNKNIKTLKKKFSSLKSLDIKSSMSIHNDEILADNYELNQKYKKKFNLKNYFKEFRGKEYLITPSFSTINLCLKKSSCGPNIKLEHTQKINLNKFKRNQTLDKNLNYIIDVNDYRDGNKNSYLHLAVVKNNEKLVKYYLDKNFSPNEQNILGNTPLHYAVELKNKNIIQLLINNGGDVNTKNNKGITPYDLADRDILNSIKFNNI